MSVIGAIRLWDPDQPRDSGLEHACSVCRNPTRITERRESLQYAPESPNTLYDIPRTTSRKAIHMSRCTQLYSPFVFSLAGTTVACALLLSGCTNGTVSRPDSPPRTLGASIERVAQAESEADQGAVPTRSEPGRDVVGSSTVPAGSNLRPAPGLLPPKRLMLVDGVTGQIGSPREVDTIPFTVKAGQEVVVLYRALDSGGASLKQVVPNLEGTDYLLHQTPDWEPLEEWHGTLRSPRAGTLRLLIGSNGDATGAYRVWIYRIDPAPESISARLAVGASAGSEGIDYLEDVDTFSFQAQTGQDLEFVLEDRSDVAESFLRVNVRGPTDQWLGDPIHPFTSDPKRFRKRVTPGSAKYAGRYRVTVQDGPTDVADWTPVPPYRVSVNPWTLDPFGSEQ